MKSTITPHPDAIPPDPLLSEFVARIRQDATDFLTDALHQAELGNWDDAHVSADIAQDRLAEAARMLELSDAYR